MDDGSRKSAMDERVKKDMFLNEKCMKKYILKIFLLVYR